MTEKPPLHPYHTRSRAKVASSAVPSTPPPKQAGTRSAENISPPDKKAQSELEKLVNSLFKKPATYADDPEYQALLKAKEEAETKYFKKAMKHSELKKKDPKSKATADAEQAKKVADKAHRQAGNKVDAFEQRAPDAWMAFNVAPEGRYIPQGKSQTNTENLDSFRYVPSRVHNVSKNLFLKMYQKFEKNSSYIPLDKITNIPYMEFVKKARRNRAAKNSTNESGIVVEVAKFLESIVDIHAPDVVGLLPIPYSYHIGSANTKTQMDAGMGELLESGNMRTTIAMEVKRGDNGTWYENYASVNWTCEMECDDEECKSERHANKSCLRQLYNYMVVGKQFFGVLCNFNSWVGFVRNCNGDLFIIDTLAFNELNFSVALFIVMFCRMAEEPGVALGIFESVFETSVSAHDANCEHDTLPDDCDVEKQQKNNKNIRGTPFSEVTKKSGEGATDSISVNKLCSDTMLGCGRLGKTFLHASDPTKVVKIVDTSKSTREVQDPLGEISHELDIYNKLEHLAKEQQVIPQVFAAGVTFELFLFAIVMEHAGQTLSKYQGEAACWDMLEEQALQKLRLIHRAGVLHGDLRAENIMVDEQAQIVRFIDFDQARFVRELSDDATKESMAAAQEELELQRIFSECCSNKKMRRDK